MTDKWGPDVLFCMPIGTKCPICWGAQTSSPSYLLLASLDAARAEAQRSVTFEEPLAAARAARAALVKMPGVSVLSPDNVSAGCSGPSAGGRAVIDPLRLTLDVSGLGLSGEWRRAAVL
jgi:arginine decarboxylase